MVMDPLTKKDTPQFIGGGPTVFEKNTFIDIDDVPRPSELDRSRTAPPDISCEMFGEHFPELQARVPPIGSSCSSSSTAAEERCDRTEELREFDEAVCAPDPSRKLSGEELDGLGNAATEECEARPYLDTSQQPLATGAVDHHRGHGMAGALPCRSQVDAQFLPSNMASGGVPQPQTLSALKKGQDSYEVAWTVDARKLKSNDKQAVSPPFELAFNDQHPKVTFKMMIYPKVLEDGAKGSACFKKSNGRGVIQLKCEGDLSSTVASVSFQLAMGNTVPSERPLERRPERGPVQHNFAQSAVCGLPKTSNETWDFNEVVDHKSMTFHVLLYIKTRINQVQ